MGGWQLPAIPFLAVALLSLLLKDPWLSLDWSMRCSYRLKVPQEYLGHSREAMTDQTHVHLQDSILGEAAELLSGRLTGTLGSDKVQ